LATSLFNGPENAYALKKFHPALPWAISFMSAAAALFLAFAARYSLSGVFAVSAFLALAWGFQRHEALRGYIFTTIILAAVTGALYFPEYFIAWGPLKLSGLIIPLMQVIMFGIGTSMGIGDFVQVVKNPRGVLIGVVSQFVIMPLTGLLLARVSNLEPAIAAGIILVGCSPSGVASNVMAFLARANLALSITLTSCTTLLAPLLTPLLMKTLAGAYIAINVQDMMLDISRIILLPIAAGLVVNKVLAGRVQWLERAMTLLSMAGIALIIVVITAAGRDRLLHIGFLLILIAAIHNGLGYLLGYWSARLFRLEERDARTIAIEVGLQNAGLASAIAKGMGQIATVGLAASVFGPIMNISGSMLASYWHKRPPRDRSISQTAPESPSPYSR